MTCIICHHGETEPGATTVTFSRDGFTLNCNVTSMTETAAATERRSEMTHQRPDWQAIAGITFAVLFMVAAGGPESPEGDAPMSEWTAWATDSGNGNRALLAIYAGVVASLVLVVFASGIAQRIRGVRGVEHPAAGWVRGLAVVAAVLFAVGVAAGNVGPIPYLFEDDIPDPTGTLAFQQLDAFSYMVGFVASALALAAVIAVTGSALRASLPRWFVIFSYATAVLLLAAVFFVPLFLIPLWTLVAGVVFLRNPAAS